MSNFNILIILANPDFEANLRNKTINDLCKLFGEKCLTNKANVEIIDLHDNLISNSKIIEYQIKIKSADKIIVFHSVFWQNIPANLSNFLDKVLTNGFAFERIGGKNRGLLDQKLLILAFGESSPFEQKVIYGNILENFWQRAIADFCGFDSEFCYFGNFRKVSETEITNWSERIMTLADKYSTKFSFERILGGQK